MDDDYKHLTDKQLILLHDDLNCSFIQVDDEMKKRGINFKKAMNILRCQDKKVK